MFGQELVGYYYFLNKWGKAFFLKINWGTKQVINIKQIE
jgi:hypothetical protein